MPDALAELAQRDQWVVWKLVARPGESKPTKVPFNARTGTAASTTDPSTWSSYRDAVSFAEAHDWVSGVGYVLSADDPYVGIDLDGCRDPASGGIEPWAKQVIRRLMSYTEISPSGTGLRIFVRGELPPHGRRKGKIEVYCQARFLTITGSPYGAAAAVINERREELLEWHREVFGDGPAKLNPPSTNGAIVVAAVPSDLNDMQLLEKARLATNGSRFWALWNGDYSAYPTQSEGDLALANLLAFWCGPDPGRIDQLFRLSGLAREKWLDRQDYREATIGKALDGRTDYYDSRFSRGSAAFGIGAAATAVNGGPKVDAGASPWKGLMELTTEAPEQVRQLVEHFIWEGRTHWLYSGPGAGKTLLELAICMHMAAGKPFHGLQVIQGAAVFIEEDSSESVIAEYVRMLAEIYEISLEGLPIYFNRYRGLRLRDGANLSYLLEMIAKAPEKPAVCVVDACERLVPSEHFNSNELDPLAQFFATNQTNGITNVMIDHTRKPQPNGGEKVDLIDMLYGGRAKSAISDVMMYFSGAIKNRATVLFPKFRGTEPTPVQLGFDGAAGFTVRAGRPNLNETERQVMEVLNNAFGEPLTREEIAAEAHLAKTTLNRAINKLRDIGWVDRLGDNREAKYRPTGLGGGLFQ